MTIRQILDWAGYHRHKRVTWKQVIQEATEYWAELDASRRARPNGSCHCYGIVARSPGDLPERHAAWCPSSLRAPSWPSYSNR
jgi:hypothetical protein